MSISNKYRPKSALLWPLAVLALGALTGGVLLWTAPETQPQEETRSAKIVQTISVAPSSERITVSAQGTVIPAQKIVIRPEVRGRVVRHHPALLPGGQLLAGEELIGIDPADYELALTEQLSALEEAKFELEMERGRQVVASREWRLLETDLADIEVNRSLALREPHLRRTEALLRRATNEIAKAKLNLARTSVAVPFNAMVLSESVEMGQLVEPGSEICTLVGTDEFWVQAALPLNDLKWISLPSGDKAGATADVVLDTGNGSPTIWKGSVVRLLSDLEPVGRMARILIRVPDPMSLRPDNELPPLLLGSYVRVEIDAGEMRDVLKIPRQVLREGNRIWVVNTNNELQIHDVQILWAQKDSVLVANRLHPGDQLVFSGIRVALPGMRVDPQPISTQ